MHTQRRVPSGAPPRARSATPAARPAPSPAAPLARLAAGVSLRPADVLHLQRTVGNRAVVRLLAGGAGVQRAITVAGERITHGSRRVNSFFTDVVLPRLEAGGYKTFGIKSKVVEFIRSGADATFTTTDAFWDALLPWLGTQTRRVSADKTTPVLKQFTVGGMARPAWSDAIRTLKGYQAGDNIRHVVRNATLKRSLEIEFGRVPEAGRKGHFVAMAGALGVTVSPTDSIDVILPAIYHALYLNPDNLFSGGGTVNQVIGFAADRVQAYGEGLLALGEAPVNMLEVYRKVMELIYAAAGSVRADPGEKELVTTQINDVVLGALRTLVPNPQDPRAPAELAGELVADMGLNFGFDLIDGRVAQDQEGIAQRQARLLRAEGALQAYLASNGAQGNLTAIYREFMGL